MWHLQFFYYEQAELHSEVVSLGNSELEIIVSSNPFLIALCWPQGIIEILIYKAVAAVKFEFMY